MDNALLTFVDFMEAIGRASMLRVVCYVVISGLFAFRAALRPNYRFVFAGLATTYGVAVFFALSLAINDGAWLWLLRGVQTFQIVWIMAWASYYAYMDFRMTGIKPRGPINVA